MAEYYIGRDNKQFGPFPFEQLLANGLTPDTLVWCSGMPSWEKAKDVPELAGLFAPQQPQYQPQYQQPAYQQPAYQQPQYPQYQQPAYQHPQYNQSQATLISDYMGWNIAVIVLGLVLCCNIIPMIFGIIGVIYSSGTKTAVASGDMMTAQSKSHTAKIMAIIGFSVLALWLVVLIFSFFMGMLDEMLKNRYY